MLTRRPMRRARHRAASLCAGRGWGTLFFRKRKGPPHPSQRKAKGWGNGARTPPFPPDPLSPLSPLLSVSSGLGARILIKEEGRRHVDERKLPLDNVPHRYKPPQERSLRLVGAATELRATLGEPLSPANQAALEEGVAPARKALGATGSAAAERAGAALPLEQAMAYALEEDADVGAGGAGAG